MSKGSKEDEKIKKYLKNRSVLLVTESPTDRTAWKKLFVELGVALNNFHNASTLHDAKSLIETKKVDILFTSHKLNDNPAFELLEDHIDKYPDRTDYFCYFVSDKNSLALAALVAEMEVDGLIIKPYNQQDLINIVKESLLKTLSMSKELKKVHEIMGDIRSKNLETALERSQEFINKLPDSPNGYFLNGLSNKHLGNLDIALETWQMGLTKDDKHYQTMCSIFDTYSEMKQYSKSYEVSKALTSEYPINPSRIPNLIRSSLATRNYTNLIQFCEMVIGLDEDLDGIRKPIAAALALSAKSLLEDSSEENGALIEQASKKAINLTELQSKIYLASIDNLLKLGKYDDVKKLIDLIPSDEMITELVSLELLLFEKTEKSSDVFIKAQTMVKENQITPDVFRILLRSAKEIGKSKDQLEDIIYEGAKNFPEIKAELEQILG